jgi:hypothetical protein
MFCSPSRDRQSGISLYTPRLLVILAYMETEGETASNGRGSGTRNRKAGHLDGNQTPKDLQTGLLKVYQR